MTQVGRERVEVALRYAEQRATAAWAREEHDRLELYATRHAVAQPALQLGADESKQREGGRLWRNGDALISAACRDTFVRITGRRIDGRLV